MDFRLRAPWMVQLFLFLTAVLLYSCASVDRSPAGSFSAVQAFSRKLGDGSSMILVGLEAPEAGQRSELTPQNLDQIKKGDGKPEKPVAFRPADFGFDADPNKWIIPKYLVARGDRMGPQKIYVFESGGPRSRWKTFGNKREIITDTFNDYSLPAELVEVGKARPQLLRASLKELALSLINYSPLIPLAVFWSEKHREHLDWSKYHATYWERLINQALDNPGSMPDFEKEFSRGDLQEIGFALAIRFNRNGRTYLFGNERWEGILMSENHPNKVDLFNVYRGLQKNTTERNLGQLVKLANEQGLILIPFGPNVAILFYDKTDVKPKEHWRALNINTQAPEEIEALRKKTLVEKGNLVPLGIYVLTKDIGPVQLTDIHDPLKVGLQQKIYTNYRFARNMGYSLFLPNWLSFTLRLGEGGIRWGIRKSGKAWFDYELSNYAELEVLLDSGLVNLDPEEVVMNSFCLDAESWGITDERGAELCKEMNAAKADPERLNTVVREAIKIMMNSEKKTAQWIFGNRTPQEPQRLNTSVQFMNWLKSDRLIRGMASKIAKTDQKRLEKEKLQALKQVYRSQQQQLKEDSQSDQEYGPQAPSTILFMVDGLAYGEIEEASRLMDLPNLKKLFVDAGENYSVFATRSLSMPSWGTILTGHEMDEHGLRSNTTATHFEFRPELLTDARKDLLIPKNASESRSHRKIADSGLAWIPRLFPREQVLINFTPINDGAYPPVVKLVKKVAGNVNEVLFGTFESANALDEASAEKTADAIADNPGRYRLVMNWYAAIDTHTHSGNATKFRSFKVLDKAIGKVIEAAKKDPVLKNASVVLVSDHGFVGGISAKNLSKPFADGDGYLNNTGMNLTKFFAGDYEGHRDLRFVVAAAESPEPMFDFKFLREFLIHPFSYTYRGAQKNRGPKNMLVDYSGDRLAQIFISKGASVDVAARMSLHQIQNFNSMEWGAEESFRVNLPDTLLRFDLNNLEVTNKGLADRIRNQTKMRPVEFFAMALSGASARQSVDQLLETKPEEASDRDPVLICAFPWKCGIVQTRRVLGQDLFRYSVVKDLAQNERRVVTGVKSSSPSDDPIGYLGTVLKADEMDQWRSDRDWLRLSKDSEHPTILFGLVRTLTNSPRYAANMERESELPDFVLTANFGFNFNSSRLTEGDHGAFRKQESQMAFVISGLGLSAREKKVFTDPRPGRDVAPTLIDLMGKWVEAGTQGVSLVAPESP